MSPDLRLRPEEDEASKATIDSVHTILQPVYTEVGLLLDAVIGIITSLIYIQLVCHGYESFLNIIGFFFGSTPFSGRDGSVIAQFLKSPMDP